MARFTVRIDDDVREEMKEVDGVNWSEYMRKAVQERLGGPKHRKIKRLVQREKYQSNTERLWVLHMFSEGVDLSGVDAEYMYETAELIFGEERDEIVEDVLSDLNEEGIESSYDKLEGGEKAGDSIGAEIATSGISEIKEQTKNKVNNASRKVREGLSLLINYIDSSSDYSSIYPKGFERTWSIYSDSEVDMDDIVATGMAYKGYYSSNAYSHRSDRIPNYSMGFFEEVVNGDSNVRIRHRTPSVRDMRDLVDDERYLDFLRWMEGTRKYVKTYDEEEEVERALDEKNIDMDWEEFREIREELIDKHILVIDCSPHRSSTGNRSSRPERWKYELTNPVVEELSDLLLGRIEEL